MDLNKLELEVFYTIEELNFKSMIKFFAQNCASQLFFILRTLLKDKQNLNEYKGEEPIKV